MDSQEKLISELLNNIQGCNLATEEGADWNKLISDYFTNGGSFEDDEEEEFEGDNTDTSGSGENGGLLQNEEHSQVNEDQEVSAPQLIPFNPTGDVDQQLHIGEQIAADQALDVVSEHLAIEQEKVQNFKCPCKNSSCHDAFTNDAMLESRLQLRAFTEGRFEYFQKNVNHCYFCEYWHSQFD